jgi:hypothetical protein
MGELGHIVRFVEFGWVDLIDRLGVDFLLCAIVTLDEELSVIKLIYYESAHKGILGIS